MPSFSLLFGNEPARKQERYAGSTSYFFRIKSKADDAKTVGSTPSRIVMTNYIHDYIQSRFLILKMAKTLEFIVIRN